MATVSGDSSRSLAVGDWGRAGEADSKSDRYLAKRLAAAGADYKGVALITFLLGASVGVLAWLAIGVALEHWVVPGGLPRWARWAWLAALLTALAAAAVRWIVPLVRYRVNLVYAARAIEHEHPDLHNDIVNAVLVKAHPDGSAPMVVRSLERRAARRLSGLPAEGVIDRSLAVRLAYALAVLVGAACLYQVVAPKSLVMSMVRLVAPWAGVAAPSRVQLSAPRLSWRMPGDDREAAASGDLEGQRLELNGAVATLVRGRQLVVAVDVRGLRRDERATLTVTPMRDDGSFDVAATTWQTGMERRRASDTHVAVLPDAARGIDHSLEFVVAAGDARTEPVRVAVVDSPSLLVREIRYDFPAYTRLPPETVQWQGDVRAVEGTRVTVVAESNRPLAEAWIEFDGSGKHDRVMKVGASDLARATASFDLRMNADRSAPEHATYRLVFRPRGADGSKAEQVVGQMDHRIEVVADLAPEISIEHPRESPLRVPTDAPVSVAVRAVDPDFGLARVGIEMRLQDGRPLPDIAILGKPTAGGFKGVAEFVPAKLGAAAGAAIEYRGVAADTRPQQPNVAHTQWQKLIIDPSAPPPAPPPQKPDAPREQDQQADKQSGGEAGADQQEGKQENGSQQDGKKQDGKQEGGEQQDAKQPNGGGEAAGGQEGKPQDQSQSDGRQPEGKKEQAQAQKEPGKKEQGQDEPGKQNGANDGSQKGTQQSNDAGSSGAKQSGQQPQQPGGSQKNNGSDAAGGGKQSGAKAQDGGGAESKSGGRDGKGQQGDGRNQQQQQQQSGAQQGDRQKPRDTVAADGTNDGKAMERILEHRRQQEGQQGQQDQQGQKQDQQAQKQEGGQKQEQGQKQQGQQGQQGQKKEGCPDCAGPDGKPCGKPGCSSCKGGGSKPGGGASGSSSGGAGQQSGQGEEQGQGQQQGQKEGQGQGQEGQGKEGQSKEGQGDGGQGQNGQGNERGNQQGASDGKQPGTQPGKQSGKGADGAGQPAASGGQPSEQSGEGEPGAGEGAGSKQSGGEQAGEGKGSRPSKDGEKGAARAGAGDDPGNETSERGEKQGPASGDQPSDQTKPPQQGQPGRDGKPGEQSQPGQEGLQAGKPSDQVSPTGRGGWSNGERESRRGDDAAGSPPPARETEWGEQELASARNAADLAIEHLRKSIDAGRTDVLEQLGWTPEQARAFLDRWQSLRRLAGSDDPRQRGEFDRAIRSLGLRPDGVRSSRDVPADVKGGQAEGRRTRPPSEYRDQVKAYLQGTGTE